MLQEWQLFWISLIYIGLLFALAILGKKPEWLPGPRLRPLIYSLTLAVYCSSWSFLGTAGQAAKDPLSYLPVFIGPIAIFIFGWPLLQRIIRVSHRLKLTSVADLIAARFGHYRPLASLVTLVAVAGTMPYMALQLKAIVGSIQVMVPASLNSAELGAIVAVVLICFTLLFGIRTIDVTERHPGLMLAIAFESVLKLIAFVVVGIVITITVFGNPLPEIKQDIVHSLTVDNAISQTIAPFIGSMIITMTAFLCLPRQFQVMVVESQDSRETRTARWLFPLYLAIFAFFAAPLGKAGEMLLGDSMPTDSYVLYLPHFLGSTGMSILAYLGALSAASSMVIIASIALATMLNNELVFPLMFRRLQEEKEQAFDIFRQRLTTIRKLLVILVITLGYLSFLIAPPDTLASLGEMAFGAIGQIAPGLLAAFYWPRATRHGVTWGLIIGIVSWSFLVLFPHIGLIAEFALLRQLMLPTLVSGTLLSLLANLLTLWLVSVNSRVGVLERVQAGRFMEQPDQANTQQRPKVSTSLEEMQLLASGFVGKERARESFSQLQRSLQLSKSKRFGSDYQLILITHTERLLSSVMGSSSARLVLNSALAGRDIALNEVAQLVEDASSERIQFSQSMLQSAIENAGEGISVIDEDLCLVAWNQRYIGLFNYPPQLVRVGTPVGELLRYNLEQGLLGPGEIEGRIQRRIQHFKRGTAHTSERELPDGRIIRIQGNPMPFGGFVMTFSDITVYRHAERLLRRSNIELEQRVSTRTQELEKLNQELVKARQKAEQANRNKSDYLKNCSHDLMQPLEAARLFAAALSQQGQLPQEGAEQLSRLESALKTASDLITDMSEVARIESGQIQPQITKLPIQQLMGSLQDEFNALAIPYHVQFHVVASSGWVETDAKLLRRILQNLLANAFRYASGCKVLLGCRRKGHQLIIQVWDSGPGIDKEKQVPIFEPFIRLHNNNAAGTQGLGLGLSITKGLCRILNHDFGLVSEKGKGAMFYVTVPRVAQPKTLSTGLHQRKSEIGSLYGVRVLCVDNDPSVLQGMADLLSGWGCEVVQATGIEQALNLLQAAEQAPDIMLVDYQLDQGENGLELMQQAEAQLQTKLPGVLLSADTDPQLPELAASQGFKFMRKMIKPARLRALITSCLSNRQ